MTYEQALAFWFSRVNFEQRTPQASDLNLDRMRSLLSLLRDPQRRLRIVHVAGSKGKGSTSAMLAAILGAAGYRTGLFTSPHLCRVEERIQVDGQPVSAEELRALLSDVETAIGSPPCDPDSRPRLLTSTPTFFEVTTALGFLHFVRRRTDAAVVEVGLGGRFDSTNVCDPVLSVITSISLDHVQQLGNTLESIAFEKAGIVKPRRPVVSGAAVPEASAVIERICCERKAPLCQLGVNFRYQYQPARMTEADERPPRVQVVTRQRAWPEMELALLG
jgi:dihydrofolate synthase/folylpolyglutamate synthase